MPHHPQVEIRLRTYMPSPTPDNSSMVHTPMPILSASTAFGGNVPSIQREGVLREGVPGGPGTQHDYTYRRGAILFARTHTVGVPSC